MFLEISQNFTGEHLCQSLFFKKVAGFRPATLLKKRLWHRCFPENFANFLRTPFLQSTSGRLLLKRAPSNLLKNNNQWCKKNKNPYCSYSNIPFHSLNISITIYLHMMDFYLQMSLSNSLNGKDVVVLFNPFMTKAVII